MPHLGIQFTAFTVILKSEDLAPPAFPAHSVGGGGVHCITTACNVVVILLLLQFAWPSYAINACHLFSSHFHFILIVDRIKQWGDDNALAV